jgi:hypothetical protein
MLEVQLSMLHDGQLIDHELYDGDGNVLFRKGNKVSSEYLESLKQRNITTLFLIDDFQDKELEKLLSAEYRI